MKEKLQFPQAVRRIFCVLLALVMLVTVVAQPQETYAASKKPYYIRINRQQNCVTIYKLDKKGKYTIPVKAMACSVGVNNATPTGTFPLSTKYRWHALMGSVYGQYCSRITGGVLFHSVFYSTTNPSTLAYNSYNRLGTTASHGCVRLNVADAKWIYDNCPSGTLVNIYDSNNPGPLGKPTPVKIDVNSKYRGWDPTDPNENNPWRKMAPKITGTRKITVERLAKAPNMKKGVTATDYKGKTFKVTMSGKINMKKAGKYRITYKAKDSLSNVTTKYSYVTVKDTKKPVVKAKKKTLTIKENLSEKKLMKLICQNVKATDSKEKLSSKYVTVSAKTLLKAMKSKKYGTYKVTVVAKDKAGNKSKKITIKVKYVNPNPKPSKPDDNKTDDNKKDDNQKPDDNKTDDSTKDDSSTGDDTNEDGTNKDNTDEDNTNKDNTDEDNTNQDNTSKDNTTNSSDTTNGTQE